MKQLTIRKFVANAPNKLWVADITYIPTYGGFLFLAIVLDAFSRRVVGYAMSSNMRTQLVLDALNMAIERRRPDGVIHHSDQGTQYTSIAFGSRCREANVRPSMGSVGDCYDNAMCESFNATLECELLDQHRFRTHKEAELAIFDFIEGWYNLHRRHSSLGYRIDSAGNIYVSNDGSTHQGIAIFAPGSNGNATPGSYETSMALHQKPRTAGTLGTR